MAQNISSFIFNAVAKINGGLGFVICLGGIVLIGIIQIVIVLLKGEYKLVDFIRQTFLYLSVCLFQLVNILLVQGKWGYLLINLLVCSIFFSVTLCLPIKGKKLKKEERELAQFIDKQLRLQNLSSTVKEENPEKNHLEVLEVKPVQSKVLSVPIDYSHVKNVIERLNYFPLSVTDRRQVRELEGLLIEAESGEETPLLKSKINDGLGALLKIMSKHGA